jgi:hypothetical protein
VDTQTLHVAETWRDDLAELRARTEAAPPQS